MKFQTSLSAYKDGVVSIYEEIERKTDFAAKRNASSLDDLVFIVKLDFAESSKRIQDLEFAEQNGFSLSYKIKTRHVPNVKVKHKAVINGYLYDISYIDKAADELYLYLEEVRKLDS